MVRTQIQITEEQAVRLRSMSADRRQSVAELIRLCIDAFLEREVGADHDRKVVRAKSAAGRFSSSEHDVSAEHDRYLAEAFSGR